LTGFPRMMIIRAALTVALCIGLVGAPLAAQAQRTGKVYRIGVLFEGTPLAEMARAEPRSAIFRAFLHELRDLGYVEGQNVVIERRSAEGRPERLPMLAAELVRLNVDVILASGEQTTPVILAATSTIPIVQPTLMDPVERGYAQSLARPGRNITGLSSQVDWAIYGKLLELLQEAAPHIGRVAVLHRTVTAGSHTSTTFEAMAPAAERLRVKLVPAVVDREDQFAVAFATLEREHADALIVEANGLNAPQQGRIVPFAARNRMPTASPLLTFAANGGLISYGPSVPENFRRAAAYVDKILKGVKPDDLPIEQPTKFDLVINMKTAKALGLTIPQSLLLRADEVIQ
jgi:putative ABC transport system substrate-binding protein